MKVNARKLIEIDFNQLSHCLLARFKIQQWCWWQFLSPKSKQSLFKSKFWNLKVNYFFMRGPFILWALYQHLFDVWVVTRFLCGFIPRLNLMARVNIDRGSFWSTKDYDESVFKVPAQIACLRVDSPTEAHFLNTLWLFENGDLVMLT